VEHEEGHIENPENLAERIKKNAVGYKEGAIAGGLAGLILAAYLRKRILVGVIIGVVAGGYIGYEIQKSRDGVNKFTKPNT